VIMGAPSHLHGRAVAAAGRNTTEARIIQARLQGMPRYYRWLRDLTAPWLAAPALEVGVGGGHFTSHLATLAAPVTGLDIEQAYLTDAQARFGAAFVPLHADIGLPLAPDIEARLAGHFGSAVCFNVLEHIRDDRLALANMAHMLRPRGHLLLFVPAFPCIFGSLDRADAHERRYARADLRRRLAQAGFDVVRIDHMNLPGFFGWWWNGRVRHLTLLTERQYRAYDRLVPWIARVERRVTPPFGQSLFAVARRGASGSSTPAASS